MGVDEGRGDVVDELATGAQSGGNAPRFLRGEIEFGGDDGGSGLSIFECETFGIGGERDNYVDAERTEDSHLLVGPSGADGGLHDVQELHGGDHSNPERRGGGGKNRGEAGGVSGAGGGDATIDGLLVQP